MGSFARAYPFFHNAGKLTPQFFLYTLVFMLYYLAFEFFFRGFMLFGLRERFGDFYSLLIQTIPTCLIHIGKPEGEIFASILSGLLFGFIALRTKSIWYVVLLHWGIGVMLNVFLALI
jgi:membrane protease YdiL (CAAX protease family)